MSSHPCAFFRRHLPTPQRLVFAIAAAGMLCTPVAADASDDLKVVQLEQDVRDLQRQVQMLSRQIEAQRPLPAPIVPAARSVAPPSSSAPSSAIPAWVDASKWRKLTLGMSELEVVTALGPPTSMRIEEGQRVLLYALEIGSSGFLGGSVTLRDRAVVRIQKPVLQ